jgi:hypothetical protein
VHRGRNIRIKTAAALVMQSPGTSSTEMNAAFCPSNTCPPTKRYSAYSTSVINILLDCNTASLSHSVKLDRQCPDWDRISQHSRLTCVSLSSTIIIAHRSLNKMLFTVLSDYSRPSSVTLFPSATTSPSALFLRCWSMP